MEIHEHAVYFIFQTAESVQFTEQERYGKQEEHERSPQN
jgi:hypothetical protein